MKVLICGSRGWHDDGVIETVISGLTDRAERHGKRLVIVHGDNRGGADALADRIGRRWGADVRSYPADWGRFKNGAGPVRNQQMLDEESPEEVWAFRCPGKSNGTDDMVDRSKAAGVPTYVVTKEA